MTPTWILLLVLYVQQPSTVRIPTDPISGGAEFSIHEGTEGPALNLKATHSPMPTKMTAVEADSIWNQATAVQITFPTKEGCDAAAKTAEALGKGVCLEIK
jgi:hypothetical protein